MKNWFVRFWKEEDGMGTLEILLIVVVLVGVALMFREKITKWVQGLLESAGNGVTEGGTVPSGTGGGK